MCVFALYVSYWPNNTHLWIYLYIHIRCPPCIFLESYEYFCMRQNISPTRMAFRHHPWRGGGSDKSNLMRIWKKERELRLLCQSLHKTRGTREKTFSPEEDRERRGEDTITVERTTKPTMHDVSPPFWGGGAAYICFILKHIHAYTTKPPTPIHHIYNT